jgi:hypothetical protein
MTKAKAFRLFGIALTLGGLAAAMVFTAMLLGHRMLPIPALDPQSWLPAHPLLVWLFARVPAALPFALLGGLAAIAGFAIARRQGRIIRIEKARARERLRRVQQYRSDEAPRYERVEPFIGPGTPETAEARRRVA